MNPSIRVTVTTDPPFGVMLGSRLFAYCPHARRDVEVVGTITEVITPTDHYFHWYARNCCCPGHVRGHQWRPQ